MIIAPVKCTLPASIAPILSNRISRFDLVNRAVLHAIRPLHYTIEWE